MGQQLSVTAIVLSLIGAPSLTAGQDSMEHYHAGVSLHLERKLDEASREYDRALSLEPPLEPTPDQRAAVLRYAPRLFVTATEPFGLKDVAAIHHPRERRIAYHLLWDDDVDFPDDNDPSDHEVVWIDYDASAGLVGVATLFHGRVVIGGPPAIADAKANGMRPRIDVQWGKHGPMPVGWRTLDIETEDGDTDTGIPAGDRMTLLAYNTLTWEKLSKVGTRRKDHPLAVLHGWPSRYAGDLQSFLAFVREIDPAPKLRERPMIAVSRLNSAVLARRFLLYNFRPKLEWPE